MEKTREFIPHITPQPALSTVKIADADAPDGFVIINESDFNAKTHKRFVPKAEKAPE